MKVKVGYADFIRLCQVDNPDTWDSVLEIRGDGVYIRTDFSGAIAAEREALTGWHPTGNLNEPALKFPCGLQELRVFLNNSGNFGRIDPFTMAKWVADKLKPELLAVDPASAKQRTTRDSTYLHVIGALLDMILGKPGIAAKHQEFGSQTALVTRIADKYGGTMEYRKGALKASSQMPKSR